MATLCTSEYCPWDHDPACCAECIERGTLLLGLCRPEPDIFADEPSEDEIEKLRRQVIPPEEDEPEPDESEQALEQRLGADLLNCESTEWQKRKAETNEWLVRTELAIDAFRKDGAMSPEAREKRTDQILKELGF